MQKNIWNALGFVCFSLALAIIVGCSAPLTIPPLASPAFTLSPSPSAPVPNTPALTAAIATGTPTIRRVLTSTREPTVPTPDYAATVLPLKTPQMLQVMDSPDGEWQARITVRACLAPLVAYDVGADVLYIKNMKTGEERIADEQVLWCDGVGAGGLKGLFWSENSRYFYYTRARMGVPDGCGYWKPPYSVYDTVANETRVLGSGELSPDNTLLAAWGRNELVIWNLNEGEVARNQIVFQALPGAIAWSPNGKSIAVLQTDRGCLSTESFLTRFDAPDFKPTFSKEFDGFDLGGVVWESATELRLVNSQNNQKWRYSFVSGMLEPIPSPTRDAGDDS